MDFCRTPAQEYIDEISYPKVPESGVQVQVSIPTSLNMQGLNSLTR